MSTPVYISRNFTEIGPFKIAEVLDFSKREILRPSDFVRLDGEDAWLPLEAWIDIQPKPAAPAKPKAAKKTTAKAAKKAVAKKATT